MLFSTLKRLKEEFPIGEAIQSGRSFGVNDALHAFNQVVAARLT